MVGLSQIAICIGEMQKLRVYRSRNEPKSAWRVAVGIILIFMIKKILSDYGILQIPNF